MESEKQNLLERLDTEMANGEELHNELVCLKVQFEAEKAELKAFAEAKWMTSEIEALNAQLRFCISLITDLNLSQNELKRAHELELKEKSDKIEGI